MGFMIFGIIYIVLFIAFIVFNIIDKKNVKEQYIIDNNIMTAKVIGNVVARVNNKEEHHAVLAYIANDDVVQKECMNGFGKKLYEVGEVVYIKCNPSNVEEVELIDSVSKMKIKVQMTIFEIILMILLPLSSILMFIMSI